MSDSWPYAVVEHAGFMHTAIYGHAGATMVGAGSAACAECGWTMSARLDRVGTESGARFAFAALARIGAAIDIAMEPAPAPLTDEVLSWLRGGECQT